MLYDEGGQGNVSGAAVVADGATGFLKDVDVRGNLVSLPDIVSGGYSSARVWAEKLAERLLANMADERLGLRQVLKLSVGEATRQVQPLFGSCERYETNPAKPRGFSWRVLGSILWRRRGFGSFHRRSGAGVGRREKNKLSEPGRCLGNVRFRVRVEIVYAEFRRFY